MMKMIILRRLIEIKENLEDLLPQLDPESRVYEDAKQTLRRINRALSKVDVGNLPKDVRINTRKLKFRNGKLYGPVVLADTQKVYFIKVADNKIKDMKIFDGGIRKMEYIEDKLLN